MQFIKNLKKTQNQLIKNAKLMTKEELEEFINYDYSKQISELAKEMKIEIKPERLVRTDYNEQNKEENDISEVEII